MLISPVSARRFKFTAEFVEGGIDMSAAVSHASHTWQVEHGLKAKFPLRWAIYGLVLWQETPPYL